MYALAKLDFISPLILVAKCMTARLGLLKAYDLGEIDIVLEGDCVMVI